MSVILFGTYTLTEAHAKFRRCFLPSLKLFHKDEVGFSLLSGDNVALVT